MQRINESQAKTKSTRSVGQMRIIYSLSSQYKNCSGLYDDERKLRRSKLNMATSGTILSLSTRRSSRKPSDGGGGNKRAAGQEGKRRALGQSRAATAGHVTARRSPRTARVHKAILLRLAPSRRRFHSVSPSRSHAARDGIPEYRCCPARGTSAKGVTQVYCST